MPSEYAKSIKLYSFLEFKCLTNSDCHGKGTCTDNKCTCIPGWDSTTDCRSENLIRLLGQLTTATDSMNCFCHETGVDNWFHLIFIAFICTGDVDCNSHGFCNVNIGQCDCDSNWDISPDCSSNVNIAGLSQKNADISMADWFELFFFSFYSSDLLWWYWL